MDRRKGFTLIELLVVVAIIVILAGLLFPLAARAAELKITNSGVFMADCMIGGTVSGVNPNDYIVVPIINIPGWGWWSKPYGDDYPPYPRYLAINANGTWSGNLNTGGQDYTATMFEAYLVSKASYPACYPSPVVHVEGAPASLKAAAAASDRALRQPQRTIDWSGFKWLVKNSGPRYADPGANYFSDSTNNAWVDGNGYLHLKILHDGEHWTCVELGTTERLGYGTYKFTFASRVDNLDPRAVLGLFTWSDFSLPYSGNREIDIEFSTWQNSILPNNAQYVVQPYTVSGNMNRFQMTSAAPSVHSFSWQPNRIVFESQAVGQPTPVESWTYLGNVPPSSDERLRMNLWLNNNMGPVSGEPVEVVISNFEFTPYSDKPVYGTTNKALLDPVATLASSNAYLKTWGKVIAKDCNGVTIDDGSGSPVRILETGQTYNIGDYLTAEGVLSGALPKTLDPSHGRVRKLGP